MFAPAADIAQLSVIAANEASFGFVVERVSDPFSSDKNHNWNLMLLCSKMALGGSGKVSTMQEWGVQVAYKGDWNCWNFLENIRGKLFQVSKMYLV